MSPRPRTRYDVLLDANGGSGEWSDGVGPGRSGHVCTRFDSTTRYEEGVWVSGRGRARMKAVARAFVRVTVY